MKSNVYAAALCNLMLQSAELRKYEDPLMVTELPHPEVVDIPVAKLLSKRELKLAAIAEHNAEHERLQARTPEERDLELRKEIGKIVRSTATDAQNSLFGTGKPKRPKRWP